MARDSKRDFEKEARNYLSADYRQGAVIELGIPDETFTYLHYFEFRREKNRWVLVSQEKEKLPN